MTNCQQPRIIVGTRQPLRSWLLHGNDIRQGRFRLNELQLRVLRQAMDAADIPLTAKNMQAVADLSPEGQLRFLPTPSWSEWAFGEGIRRYLEQQRLLPQAA